MEPLLNKSCITNFLLKDEKFHRSHGAKDGFLGGGIFIYALAYALRPKLCVCLGSGSGFVPRIMCQAQFDLGFEDAKTILIDANLPEAGWGEPDYFKEQTFFGKEFPVEVWCQKTQDAVHRFEGQIINYLHIDADHSYEGAKADLEFYSQFLDKWSLVSMHDSRVKSHGAGVWKVIEEARDRFEFIDIPVGLGLAVLRKRDE